jgi:hypothetical protein
MGLPRTGTDDGGIPVPYGQDRVAKGDCIYRVAVVEGELWFFGRVIVGRIAEDPRHAESVEVWPEPGTETTWCEDECVVDESVVDGLVYLDADGTEHRMSRDDSGSLVGDAFEGRSSMLELADGGKALDQLAEA